MSKKDIKLYPSTGGNDFIIAHPTKVEFLKLNGWVEKQPAIKTMSKEKSHGKS